MDKYDFNQYWEKHKTVVKNEYPHLTDEDLKYEAGKDEELLERLQVKMNKTEKEIRNWLSLLG